MSTAFFCIGSNLGDKIENCKKAVKELAGHAGIRVVKASSLYTTEPWGYVDEDWFVNCVVQVETPLDPYSLLRTTQLIEDRLGRKRGGSVGPRVIDLDILLYDGVVLETDELTIPHPLLHKRRFVLTPLAEIAPNIIHPVLGKTVLELLNGLDDTKRVELCEPFYI
ncbi:MAG: 2-amino-4-hydroxy-6-hydroxymethyldihydropteridine diphosphokinase [Deltaproteobacteria bacterium]|nr:2-amino-4-hydroxy-6-hydroxymethyldihydropteridine diphosphokinase [Deltaproteobacteria bacterium]